MKTFVVVGGSSGIGLALVHQLTQAGHTVYTFSRHNPDNHPLWQFWDVLQPFPMENLLPDSIDGLAYLPGTIRLKPFHRIPMQDFHEEFAINVGGSIMAIQALLPRLKKTAHPSVLLFSTVAVQTGMPFHASIATVKAGIEGLTRSLAAEYAAHPIRFNAIAPSLTDTPLASSLLSSPEKREAAAKRHPIAQIGQAEDLAKVATFLLDSEQSSWITGQIWHIDGGMGTLK